MILMFSGNSFSGKVPQSITKIDGLILLDLSKNNFSGDKFPIFNSELSYLDLSSNKFSGQIPTTFGKNTTILLLGQNEFTSHLPENLTSFTELKHLDLHDNHLSGKIPEFLSTFSSLRVRNLRNNSLEGSISDSLRNLRILDLSNNHLRGTIPSSLGMINSPDIFASVTYHFGVDTVFQDLITNCQCKDLIVNWKKSKRVLSSRNLDFYSFLDLSNNGLSGQIPPSLGKIEGLKILNLSYNSLSGEIPNSFGDLELLETLDLSHNFMSGEIPQSLVKLLQLNYLDLNNNKLSGSIPEGPQMDRLNNPIWYANNSGLCGIQVQIPCFHAAAPPPLQASENDEKNELLSWKFAAIGYPVGFFSTIGIAYVIGVFDFTTRKHNHWSATRERWFKAYLKS